MYHRGKQSIFKIRLVTKLAITKGDLWCKVLLETSLKSFLLTYPSGSWCSKEWCSCNCTFCLIAPTLCVALYMHLDLKYVENSQGILKILKLPKVLQVLQLLSKIAVSCRSICIVKFVFDFREEPFYDIQLNVKGKKDSK